MALSLTLVCRQGKKLKSPADKVLANTLPTLVAGGTASVQALSGDTQGATKTLLNMGLPMLGNHGGKVLGNVAEGLSNPAAQRVLQTTARGVTTLGMAAPTVIAGKQTVDTFNQWQSGAVGPDGKPLASAGDVFHSFGNTLGSGYGAKSQMRADRNRAPLRSNEAPEFGVPTRQDPKMKPGQVEYTYKNGVPVVRHGGGVSEADLKLHRDMAWQSGNDAVNQVKGDILKPVTSFFNFGNKPQQDFKPRVGTKGYEFHKESVKHQQMSDNAFSQAQELRRKGNIAGAEKLEQKAHDLMRSSDKYDSLAQDPNTRSQKGDGSIGANKPTYDNHNQIKGLHGKQFDPAKTKLPPGYEVINLEGGRKVCATINPATGAFDMTKGIILVKPDGKMKITNDNRTSYDYLKIYKNDPNARADVKTAGFGKDGYTVHHAIPDKVASKHPLTVMAMRLNGFSVDTFGNYAPLPMKDKFINLNGAEVGHWSGHDNFDRQVMADLTTIQRDLQRKYSAPIADWSSHPQKDKIAADLKSRIETLQSQTLQNIKDGNVPMTDEGMSNGVGRIN